MPFDDKSARPPLTFAAYMSTDDGAQVAQEVLSKANGTDNTVHGGGLSAAARLPASAFGTHVVLAELGRLPLPVACECVTELVGQGVRVVLIGAANDLTTYRALREAGALDYFAQPVTADQILSVALPVPQVAVQPEAPVIVKSPSIAVLGCKGGVGASLLAQNLAAHAATEKGPKLNTALLDADVTFGTQAIDLDRDETRGLFEALKAPDRVDGTFIRATMEQPMPRLSLYSHQIGAGQQAADYEAGIARLLPHLRDEFDAVVTDLPRATLLHHPDIAQALDALILVLPAGFAGVNATSRLIDLLKREASDLKILPVLSDLRKDAELSRKDIEATLGRPIAATLPRVEGALAKSQRAAKPLIELQPRSPFAKTVRGLWDQAVTPQAASKAKPAKKAKKGLFR